MTTKDTQNIIYDFDRKHYLAPKKNFNHDFVERHYLKTNIMNETHSKRNYNCIMT